MLSPVFEGHLWPEHQASSQAAGGSQAGFVAGRGVSTGTVHKRAPPRHHSPSRCREPAPRTHRVFPCSYRRVYFSHLSLKVSGSIILCLVSRPDTKQLEENSPDSKNRCL